MQQPKRIKTGNLFDDVLCVCFKECKWIMLYHALTLDCDTPILEALLFSTFAFTAIKRQSDSQQLDNHRFVRRLKLHLCKYVQRHTKWPWRQEPDVRGMDSISSRYTTDWFELWVNRKLDPTAVMSVVAMTDDEPIFQIELHVKKRQSILVFHPNSETPIKHKVKPYEFPELLTELKNNLITVFNK
jgi:hypothetical protein